MSVLEYMISLAVPNKVIRYMKFKIVLDKSGILQIFNPYGKSIYMSINFVP